MYEYTLIGTDNRKKLKEVKTVLLIYFYLTYCIYFNSIWLPVIVSFENKELRNVLGTKFIYLVISLFIQIVQIQILFFIHFSLKIK